MLNKNDPLIGAVQEVMKKNHAEREAIRLVNEKFGVHNRKALPHEKQSAWDAAYKQVLSEGLHPNQQKLDVHEPEKDKLTKHDFKMLRAKKKPMEEENAPKTDPYAEGQASSISTVAQPKKEVTPADQSALKKKIMSIKEAKSNAYAIGMAAVKKSTGDEPPMEKKNIMKAHKIAKKIIAKKKMDEGFNNRHNSSVKASVEEQVVAEIAAYPGTPAGFAASSSSMQAAERQRRMGERRSELIAQRQQGGDVAPKPQPNMTLQRQQSGDVAPRPQSSVALQRQQSGDTAPRPQSSVALQRRQSGDVAPRPQPNMALRRQQSGDVAPRPQSSVALQRQQSGDVAPRPQGQASPMMGQGTSKSSVKPNAPGVDRGRALQAQKSASALGGFGANKTLKTAPAAPAAAAPVKKTVPAARPKTVTSVKKPTALQRQMNRSRMGRDAAVTGPGGRRG
jgi:hypothetical protein